jgi:hypothetical protein
MARTGAVNVGGIQDAVGETPFEEAVAAAMTSRFGTGGARFHLGGGAGPVDTVYLGVFRREAIEEVGLFDEHLVRNQDYELNIRLRKAGGTVWFDPQLSVTYRPRGTLRGLAKQYYEYGWWKAEVICRHPESMRPRQAAPALATAMLIGCLVLAPRSRMARLPLGGYGALTAASAMLVGRSARVSWSRLMAVYPTIHFAWGSGFLASVIGTSISSLIPDLNGPSWLTQLQHDDPCPASGDRNDSEDPGVEAVEHADEPIASRETDRKCADKGHEAEVVGVHVGEVFLGTANLLPLERVLVLRPLRWRQPAIEVDDRVVPEWLDEDRNPGTAQYTGEFGVRPVEIQVVEHARAADEVERSVLELELLRIHLCEGDRRLRPLRRTSSSVDRRTRDVDRPHGCTRFGECNRLTSATAAVLQNAEAGCPEGTETPLVCRLTGVDVVERPVRPRGIRLEPRLVERSLTFLAENRRIRHPHSLPPGCRAVTV